MKRVIIVGAGGQDGRILYDQLLTKDCAILGIGRNSVRSTEPSAPEKIDLTHREEVRAVIGSWHPDEIYYLAAHHHSSQEQTGGDPIRLFESSYAVHVLGLLHFLEAIKEQAPAARLFYAASSLVFGGVSSPTQDEQTAMNPRCIYGITKASGLHCCRFYRESHGVFASAGILYNHESVFRREEFVSQKVVRAALEMARGKKEKLILGDLAAKIDWGYAPDYVDAMTRMLALDRAEDFVVATGEAHAVQEFVELVFARLDLDWRAHVEVNPAVLQRRRNTLIGDATKLRAASGWRPSVTFREMVETLVDSQRQTA